MKYLSQPELRKVAELLKMYITQDRDGSVHIWESRPIIDEEQGEWTVPCDRPVNSKIVIAPYTTRWTKSLITPKTNKYMTEGELWRK